MIVPSVVVLHRVIVVVDDLLLIRRLDLNDVLGHKLVDRDLHVGVALGIVLEAQDGVESAVLAVDVLERVNADEAAVVVEERAAEALAVVDLRERSAVTVPGVRSPRADVLLVVLNLVGVDARLAVPLTVFAAISASDGVMTLAKALRPLGSPAVFGYVANAVTIVARPFFLAGPLAFTLTIPCC